MFLKKLTELVIQDINSVVPETELDWIFEDYEFDFDEFRDKVQTMISDREDYWSIIRYIIDYRSNIYSLADLD